MTIQRLALIGVELTERLQAAEEKIAKLESFIKRARQESELVVIGDKSAVIVPYWFMKDEYE